MISKTGMRFGAWRAGLRAGALAALTLVAACADDPAKPDLGEENNGEQPTIEVRSVPRPVMSQMHLSSPVTETCGTPTTLAMWANMYVPGGSVKISNDANNLYVTYNITHADYYISDTRLAVEKNKSAIPMETATQPSPWEFKYFGEHEPVVKVFTYTIPLSSVGATVGTTLHVSAMSGIVFPTTGDYNGPWEWRTTWGVVQGNTATTIHTYQVKACAGQTPPPPPPPPTTGVITITFDDGWLDTYTVAYPILRDLGLVANLAVNPEPIDGGWSSYMNLNQVKALKAAGWSIQSHSVTHRDLTTLTDAQLTSELVNSKAWIERNGLGDSPVFIVPFHSWGARERGKIQQYYKAARGYAVDQFWPEKMVDFPVTEPYDITAYEPEYSPFTTAAGRAATMQYVRDAIDNGKMLDLLFHHVRSQDAAAFRQLMTEVAAYKNSVRTYDDIF